MRTSIQSKDVPDALVHSLPSCIDMQSLPQQQLLHCSLCSVKLALLA